MDTQSLLTNFQHFVEKHSPRYQHFRLDLPMPAAHEALEEELAEINFVQKVMTGLEARNYEVSATTLYKQAQRRIHVIVPDEGPSDADLADIWAQKVIGVAFRSIDRLSQQAERGSLEIRTPRVPSETLDWNGRQIGIRVDGERRHYGLWIEAIKLLADAMEQRWTDSKSIVWQRNGLGTKISVLHFPEGVDKDTRAQLLKWKAEGLDAIPAQPSCCSC